MHLLTLLLDSTTILYNHTKRPLISSVTLCFTGVMIKALKANHKVKPFWLLQKKTKTLYLLCSSNLYISMLSWGSHSEKLLGALHSQQTTKWQALSNLRTSSTIKPFDLASWVRKLLLLLPIFLSTRYSLTSSNFTSSRLATPASTGLDLFLTRGTTGAWNITFEMHYLKYFGTSRNFCFCERFSVVVLHLTGGQQDKHPLW